MRGILENDILRKTVKQEERIGGMGCVIKHFDQKRYHRKGVIRTKT